MSKKNIFLLAAGYVAGGIIASIYNKKKPEELKKELSKAKEAGEGSFKILLDTFINTQANLIEDLKKEVLSEKNIKLFNEHKDEVLKIIDSYKEKGNLLLKELKENGKDYLVVVSEKLEKLYNEKVSEIESLKGMAPEKVEELKSKLLSTYDELKKEIKKIKK
ncbi:MAG: hypothetical protein PHV23_00355 [Candidatus Gracilibacteria bacterium]|nr:hypothetical protein [Candidatus Gracilibacteria bacterium]